MSFPCKPWSFAVRHPVDDQDIIARNVQWLEDTQIKSGPADRKGGWSYGAMPVEPFPATVRTVSSRCWPSTRPARVAESGQISVTIHRETWERVRTYWISNQREDDGSWGYYKPRTAPAA